ncbi:MAG: NuoM family protein [Polyangiales bacterium]
MNLLSLLLAVPAIGALVIFFMPRQWPNAIRRTALTFMLFNFGLSLFLLPEMVELFVGTRLPFLGDIDAVNYAASGFQLVENHVWVESLGISYKLGIDGLSLWLVLLSTLLSPIAFFASWTSINTKIKEYAISFLLLELGMLGAFFALDLFLFYVFWELMLVPMYLIIGIWGGKDRVYAAVKFFIYTMVGSLLMLVALLWVVNSYESVTGVYTFDLELLSNLVIPFEEQLLLFSAFALAFAIKVPMFPFHTWLPDAHVQAPTGGSVILAAVLLKLGIYGFLRFAMPLFPLASQYMGPTIAVVGIIGIIYGAFCAWVQKDLKKLVAYSSVSHMGFIVLGMFAMTPHGVNGALLQMINHGVSTGALFILVGVIYERRHTRQLDEFGGLAKVMPWYAVLFIVVTMSSIGLPGTNGFIGEFMIMSGAFLSTGFIGLGQWGGIFTVFAATGVILAAIYMLHAVYKMFWGPVDNDENKGLADVSWREWASLSPLLVLIFFIGFFPNTILEKSQPAVDNFIMDFSQKWETSTQSDRLRVLGAPAPTEEAVADEAADEPNPHARLAIPAQPELNFARPGEQLAMAERSDR